MTESGWRSTSYRRAANILGALRGAGVEFKQAVEARMRTGYIKGQEDYAAGNMVGFAGITDTATLEGWEMGYHASEYADLHGMQPSHTGTWNRGETGTN